MSRDHNVKLQMPEGTCSLNLNGIDIPVAKDGTVEVPAGLAAHLRETFGATDPKKAGAPR